MKILNRTSNNINIANFWENVQLRKYNFDPEYQRSGDVWGEQDKSYLIDTILKNFPMPPVFLHQHIDTETGKTIYDVVDGKQRLSAIIAFLNNEISIPEDFSEDGFGDPELNGLFFKDLDRTELSEWKKSLWKYEITIEYIETEDIKVVNHIFDRLNRNGEPLTKQELRKAKYGNTEFYELIKELTSHEAFQEIVSKLKLNRLEHHEFISELFFLVAEDKILPGDRPEEIDNLYNKYSMLSKEELFLHKNSFNDVEKVFSSFNLQFSDYRSYGVSHIFGIWGLAWKIHAQTIDFSQIIPKLTQFYEEYKSTTSDDEQQKIYRQTMSAGTKSAARRQRRIQALFEFVTR